MLQRALSNAIRAQPCVQSRVFSVAKKSSGLPVVNHNAFPYQPKKLPRADSPWHIYGWSVANGFSIAHRVSGVAATGLVYGGTMWYLLAGSAPAMVASFAALPLLIQLPIKAAWVVPNVFHALNGVRHLDWDLNKTLTLPDVYKTARMAVFLTSVLSLWYLGSAFFGKGPAAAKKH